MIVHNHVLVFLLDFIVDVVDLLDAVIDVRIGGIRVAILQELV